MGVAGRDPTAGNRPRQAWTDWTNPLSVFEFAQLVVLLASLGFVGWQIRLQSQELHNQGKLHSFQLYHLLVQQYVELLHRADTDTDLNQIWERPDDARMAELDAAQQAEHWGAWYAMDPVERRCYRYTRSAIETFEQAYLARQRDWIDGETWSKWLNWMALWKNTRYFRYVFDDAKPRLVESFVADFDKIASIPAPHIRSIRNPREANAAP